MTASRSPIADRKRKKSGALPKMWTLTTGLYEYFPSSGPKVVAVRIDGHVFVHHCCEYPSRPQRRKKGRRT